MLRNAPKFYEVAKRIVEITQDRIIVAHNSSFDYRILRTEFDRLGYPFKRKTLCTVELSKQLIPNMQSYSLGKLSRSLGIAVGDRHRASGDALATVKLFKLLLGKDSKKSIIKTLIKTEQRPKIASNLKDILEDLPSDTGVYYIHDTKGEIIYIGKSNNIKKRVTQHFTGKDSKSKKIQVLADSVSYEKTGSELVALLKESAEIKSNTPQLNRALKKNSFSHALYVYKDESGYMNLKIDHANKQGFKITTFTNRQSGLIFLSKITEDHELCEKLTHITKSHTSCFNYGIEKCHGACIGQEPQSIYNTRIQNVIDHYSYENKNLMIVDRGRDVSERSVVVIENGELKGLGFFDLNYQILNKDVMLSLITPIENNKDHQHIVQTYVRKYKKRLKLITY